MGDLIAHEVVRPGDQIVQRRAGAAIGHHGRPHADERGEEKAAHVGGRADAAVTVVQLGRVGLHLGDELLKGRGGEILSSEDGDGCVGELADVLEVGEWIVGKRWVERGRRAVRAHLADEQRVAVGRGAGGPSRTRRAAGTADVLDDELLAERPRHVLEDDAGDHVGVAAGSVGHDHDDLPRRIILGRDAGPERAKRERADEGAEQGSHAVPLVASACRREATTPALALAIQHVRLCRPPASASAPAPGPRRRAESPRPRDGRWWPWAGWRQQGRRRTWCS